MPPAPRASDQQLGRGVNVQLPCTPQGVCDPGIPASATLVRSLVEQSHEFGVFVAGSVTTLDTTVVSHTLAKAADDLSGDGLAVTSEIGPASATVLGARIEESARAGVSSFGASVSLASTRIGCAAFDLDGEPFEARAFSFEDRGGNICGCPSSEGPCTVVSVGLEPPEPLTQ